MERWHKGHWVQGDANNDGAAAPIDVLIVMNDLNANGSRSLSTKVPSLPYLDVSDDGFVTPADVLVIMRYGKASEVICHVVCPRSLP